MIKEEDEKKKRQGTPGFEPGTSRSAVECSTTELYPQMMLLRLMQIYIYIQVIISIFMKLIKPGMYSVLMIIKLGHQKRSLYAMYSIILFSDTKSNYSR